MDFKLQPKENKEELKKLMVKEREETIVLPKTKVEVLVETAIKFETLNQREKLLKAQRETLRPIIESAIDRYGVQDANGSKIWEEGGSVLTRQRKAAVCFNTVAAEEILKKKNLWSSCSTTHTVVTEEIDEEKVIAAYSAGLISPKEYATMFTEKESFSLLIKPNEEVYTLYAMIKEARTALEKGKIKEAEALMKEVEVSDA